MIKDLLNPEKGTWVLLIFIGFFGVIVSVNTVFITKALSTHSGVVTEQPYEKGLKYNETLKVARSQPALKQKASYKAGQLQWVLRDKKGNPLEATVSARLIRPVKDGQDFDIILTSSENGIYKADLNLPMKGRWEAQLKAEWQTQQYQTRFSFLAQ